MTLKSTYNPVGVVGLGSFGTAISNLLSLNTDVILYGRNPDQVDKVRSTRVSSNQKLNKNIELTNDLEYLADSCSIIFPIIPASTFRALMKVLSQYLKPYHIVIHGIKGFDLKTNNLKLNPGNFISRNEVRTMSEVVREESVVIRVGCIAGPNLADELAQGQPSATVVASKFNEVIHAGQKLLRSDRFQVYAAVFY